MKEGIAYTGIPSAEELRACAGLPSEGRLAKGPVACVECLQCIPCNPCESACPVGAISLGGKLANVPVLDENKCVGCGSCIAKCPGLAITVLDLSGEREAVLDFPYEYLPLPVPGQQVQAVDRAGAAVCEARVLAVTKTPGNDGTAVVRIAFAKEFAQQVKSMARLPREE